MRNVKVMISALIIAIFIASSCEDLKKEKLSADFNYLPKNPKANEKVEFMSISENASEYAWDFGDNNTSSEQNPTHIFEKVGSYNVTLKVTNDDGETASKTQTLNVTIDVGAEVKHSKDITENETWSSKQVHIVTTEIEVKNATLTIEAGAVVKFNDNAALVFGYSSDVSHSKLIAKGEKDKHIKFTANKTSPQKANWRYIWFDKSASKESTMEYCDIEYGGTYSDSYGSIVIKGTGIIFNNNTVKFSASYGISCHNDGYFESFTNNAISENNGSSMKIQAKYANTLTTGNSIANTVNGIEVYNDIDIKGDFTWLNHGARYTLTSDVNIGSENGTSLTIAKGNTIAFNENKDLSIGYDDNKGGKLIAVGTADEPIKFVSAKANSSAGDWEFIWFDKFNDQNSKMEYCEIDAGGGYSDYYGAVVLKETKITFNNNKITNSNSYGITLHGASSFVSFTGNTISNSAQSSIKIPAQWTHTIGANNNIADDKYGIEVYNDFNHQKKSFTWLKQTCPYTLITDVEIGSTQGCTLTIEAGTTIKIKDGKDMSIAYSTDRTGTLIAKGDVKNKITFTSASPTGTWEFIWFGKGTTTNSILDYCTINNGGDYSSNYGAVHCAANLSNAPTISNCHISNSKNHGISIKTGSTPKLSNNTFDNINGSNVYTK